MKRALVLLVVAGALALSGALLGDEPKQETPAAPPPAEVKSISDADLSLYPGSLFETPNPAGFVWNAKDPGGNQRLERAYPIAPPRIPHGIADYVPITLRANACLDCHALDAGADAPELTASHRTDLRNASGEVRPTVAGARWLCVSCHVPTSDAAPVRTSRLPQ